MSTALLASISPRPTLAWLQQALMPAARPAPARRRSVRAISQEVRELRKGETLVLDQAGGQGVVCLEGALWITHDDTPGADAGRGPAGSRMLVRALADSRLCLPLSLGG